MKLGNLGWNLLPPTGCPGIPGTAICLKNLNLNPGIRVCPDVRPMRLPSTAGAGGSRKRNARTHARPPHHTTARAWSASSRFVRSFLSAFTRQWPMGQRFFFRLMVQGCCAALVFSGRAGLRMLANLALQMPWDVIDIIWSKGCCSTPPCIFYYRNRVQL
jgi:hypothetical protein